MPARALHKTYSGKRSKGGRCVVHVIHPNGDCNLLPSRTDLYCHIRDGRFEWGYRGRGPAQLALAILADCISDEVARSCQYDFRAKIIARFEHNKAWILKEQDVIKFVMNKMVPSTTSESQPTGSKSR